MGRKKKHEPVKLNVRPLHKLPRGHPQPLSGAGPHKDRRARRRRAGREDERQSVEEMQEEDGDIS